LVLLIRVYEVQREMISGFVIIKKRGVVRRRRDV